MIVALERFYDRMSFRHRMLLAWAAMGAMLQLCLPMWHAAAPAMWLWWLPLSVLGLDLLLFTTAGDAATERARPRRRLRRAMANRLQSRAVGAGVSVRATRPPRGLSVTSYLTPSRIGR